MVDIKEAKDLPVSTRIVRFLEDNAGSGYTNSDLARELDVTERSVRKNTARLDWYGLIRGYLSRNGNGRWAAHFKKR